MYLQSIKSNSSLLILLLSMLFNATSVGSYVTPKIVFQVGNRSFTSEFFVVVFNKNIFMQIALIKKRDLSAHQVPKL